MTKTFAIIFWILFRIAPCSGNTVDSVIALLDRTIEESQQYVIDKEQNISALVLQLNSAQTDHQRFEFCSQLYEEYRSYKYDSAYVFAERMLAYALQLNNPDLIGESKIALAFSCVSAGLYKEATEISHSIDTSQISQKNKANLYSFLSILYLNMSDFTATEPYYSQYRAASLDYCKKAIELLPLESTDARLTKMREYQLIDDYHRAIEIAEQYLADLHSEEHNYAIAKSMLGYFYEVLGNTDKAIECFALAAIADIKLAIKETTAIRQLAELIFLRGDVPRAYSYAVLALDDANFYNARQRKIEVGRTLPIIEAGRFEIIEQQKNNLLIFSILITLLLFLFLIATFIILYQKKRLTIARELILKQNANLTETNQQLTLIQNKISKQNSDLTLANKKLKEAHQIKDEYIGYFFSANSNYLEKQIELRRMVARKIKNKQFDELLDEFASIDLRKEKEEMFNMFDQIFIKIFPDFVNKYNILFKEEDHFILKPDGTLSPEIRIFALIRLGINKSEQIARFLDFSISTVKNYKTIAKNRSVIPNEFFEERIMEIESVETDTDENL